MGACSVCGHASSSSPHVSVCVCARRQVDNETRCRSLPVGFIRACHCCAAYVRGIELTTTRLRCRHLPVGFVRACRCCEACVRARRRCPSERAVSVPGVKLTALHACACVCAWCRVNDDGVSFTCKCACRAAE